MADDLDKLKGKMNRLRETNHHIVQEIEMLGSSVEITVARLEHLMQTLVNLGVLTEEQLIQSQYEWELKLKAQLVPLVRDLREHVQKVQLERQRRMREAEEREKAQQTGEAKNSPTSVHL